MGLDRKNFANGPTFRKSVVAAWVWMLAVSLHAEARDAELNAAARVFKAELVSKVLPYWHDTAQDTNHGGYLLADDLRGRQQATDKQIVTQARMVWGFSHAHRKGLEDGHRDYLAAARQGFQFIEAHFLDRTHGGYYWTTDLEGNPTGRAKILYGEAFVIYAYVEYFRASGDRPALDQAMALYHVIQGHAHDAKNKGWVEHFRADWTPILQPDPEAIVEVAGLKSANTHLHLMEALAELYAETQDKEVGASVEECLRINAEKFYPADPAKSCFHREPDWSAVPRNPNPQLSYGHNVEFAWLMIRAEQVLGRSPSWKHFDAILEHALRHGCDRERGGLYLQGTGNEPASDTEKVWWVQAEFMAALSDGLRHRENPEYSKALTQLISFLRASQINPDDGIWIYSVTADGKPKNKVKANSWKANYHDVRGIVKFLDVFPPAN
jgi:mannobiose 2-epimerase